MSDNNLKTLLILTSGVCLLAYLFFARPYYLTDHEMLSAIIIAQIVLAAVCKYRQAFFIIFIAAFLCAGTDMPLQSSWMQGRWFVLGFGALVGLAIYMKDHDHHFSTFHLIGMFCVLAAIVSALVSAYPEEAFLKAVSLLLLFVYGSSGARLAVPVLRPEKFFRGLLLACEFLNYFSAVAYFVLRWEIYGSPNSLGAVFGVVIVPVILWGLLTAESVVSRRRLGIELMVAMLVLLTSFARAGIAAAAISCLAVCIAMREYRLIAKGVAAVVVLATVAVMFVPLPEEAPKRDDSRSVTSMYLYKGKPDEGLMGSRGGVWQKTWDVIKDHPWFGSGFGTSLTDVDLTQLALAHAHIDSRVTREHGDSYLAITEWVGLLGVVPFYFLISMIALNARRTLSMLRRTGDVWSPAVPAAAILIAGLVDAAFEDWMFAVGYYLCVFFWSIAFILVDLQPAPQVVYSRDSSVPMYEPQFATASGQ